MAKTNRRDVLRYGAAGAVTAATAVVAGQELASADPPPGLDGVTSGLKDTLDGLKTPLDPRDFDELFKGKKIRGLHGLRGRNELMINNRRLALTEIETLFVPADGSPPYVGVGWISALNHYDPVEVDTRRNREGLRKLARKVVDILGDNELAPSAAQEHGH
ncbi:tyrosinase family oxidase copper chaperone [Actinoplanes philippinensis]|uniref:tyrosinase family oxidase copper chaperone n=1 Tax=Actinoplanes philippinensis TaxID=35752 RepID=UPI0033F41C69